MGVDIHGKAPRSEAGRYFAANWTAWHQIARLGDLVEAFFSDGSSGLLHRACESAFWRFLDDQGHGLNGSSADKGVPPSRARAPAFRVIGPAPLGSVCIHCFRDEGEVLRIASAEAGSKSETLHEGCAAEWFAALRNFESPTDDGDDDSDARPRERE